MSNVKSSPAANSAGKTLPKTTIFMRKTAFQKMHRCWRSGEAFGYMILFLLFNNDLWMRIKYTHPPTQPPIKPPTNKAEKLSQVIVLGYTDWVKIYVAPLNTAKKMPPLTTYAMTRNDFKKLKIEYPSKPATAPDSKV